MTASRRRRRFFVGGTLVTLALAPGWRAAPRAVPHHEVLAASRSADPGRVFGVRRPAEGSEGVWHLQYMTGRFAAALHGMGLRSSLPRIIPPDFAAYLPPGAARAEGYFAIEPVVHWPWWRPGGGLALGDPFAPDE